MKLAFSSNAYTNYTLDQTIPEIAKIGYKGIEIMSDHPHAFPLPLDSKRIDKIKKELKSNNLAISNLNAFTLFGIGDTYHPSWIEDDENYRNLRIKHTINCIELAGKLGAKNISIEPGGPILNSNSNSNKREKYIDIFVEGIKEVLPFAQEQKVKILVEPEPGLLLERSKDFLKFIGNFDSEYIGLNFDIGHFVCVNEDPAVLVNELQDYIHHFHLADIKDKVHNHLVLGQGSIDIKKVLDSIDKIDFRGFITVELYPYKDNPSKAALESFEYLKKLAK
jgi:sugar phosphate isomerase/epimerase